MATASYMSEDVEPKPMKFEDHAQKMEELKQKVGTLHTNRRKLSVLSLYLVLHNNKFVI